MQFDDAKKLLEGKSFAELRATILDEKPPYMVRMTAIRLIAAAANLDQEQKIDVLLEALRVEEPTTKQYAANQLGMFKTERAAAGLQQALDDPDLRPMALLALVQFGGKLHAEAAQSLQHGNEEERTAALLAIGQQKSPESIGLIQQCYREDADLGIRLQAAMLLLKQGVTLDEGRLAEEIRTFTPRSDGTAAIARMFLTGFLAQRGNQSALRVLRKMVSEPTDWDNTTRPLRIFLMPFGGLDSELPYAEWQKSALEWIDAKLASE